MTRSPEKVATVQALGAEPVLCDVYDAGSLRDAVVSFGPDMVMHQLTDLPDDAARIAAHSARADRMISEGTRNLVAATQAAHASRLLAQSIAWELPGDRGAVYREHERAVLEAGGVVIRYGQLYGAGSYYEARLPSPPRVSVAQAARRTVEILDVPAGIVEVIECAIVDAGTRRELELGRPAARS